MPKYKRIFAALDGGSTQEAVAYRAASLASSNNAHLLMGHVVDSLPYEVNSIDFSALREDAEQRIKEDLSYVFEKAVNDPNIPSVDFAVRVGRVNDTLLESFIEEFNPDLVICGARGLSNIKYAFVGSVSTFLIRNSACDVLVVRPEADAAAMKAGREAASGVARNL